MSVVSGQQKEKIQLNSKVFNVQKLFDIFLVVQRNKIKIIETGTERVLVGRVVDRFALVSIIIFFIFFFACTTPPRIALLAATVLLLCYLLINKVLLLLLLSVKFFQNICNFVHCQKGEIFKRLIAERGEEWVLLNNQFHERSLQEVFSAKIGMKSCEGLTQWEGGRGQRRGLGPRNDVLTACKAVTSRSGQRLIAVYFSQSKIFRRRETNQQRKQFNY